MTANEFVRLPLEDKIVRLPDLAIDPVRKIELQGIYAELAVLYTLPDSDAKWDNIDRLDCEELDVLDDHIDLQPKENTE